MDGITQLSESKCLLLAVHFAANSDITALRGLTRARRRYAFSPDLILRILLSYLPESLEPSIYVDYLHEVAGHSGDLETEDVAVDTSSVSRLSEAQARKRAQKLQLLSLDHESCPQESAQDALTRFLIHRSHRIDSETGLLPLVAQLLLPFLDRSEYLNTWFISTVLPLLRLGYEYYPGSDDAPNLADFDKASGRRAVGLLLAQARDGAQVSSASKTTAVAHDLRGLVGPWMYGDSQRKKRKLDNKHRRGSSNAGLGGTGSLGLGSSSQVDTHLDWEYVFEWLVRTAESNCDLSSNAFQHWKGPTDVDFGGYAEEQRYLSDQAKRDMQDRYAQAALASIYVSDAAESYTHVIERTHQVLCRVADLIDSLDPTPDLYGDVDSLPKVVDNVSPLRELPTAILQPDTLLKPDHALTAPNLQSYSLALSLLFSSHILTDLGHDSYVASVTRLWLRNDSSEQLAILQAILHGLANGFRKDDAQWREVRLKLLWLWDWGIKTEHGGGPGAGVFGGIKLDVLDVEILRTLLSCSCYRFIIDNYIASSAQPHSLSRDEVERAIIASVFSHYDNASNGNRMRGAMKKASDLVEKLSPYFAKSNAFAELSSLIAATHSLSFYSLTLQHGVPFQPVSIRVSQDPIGLIEKVLSQNPHSYTKLDDLIGIGRNLAAAGLDSTSNEYQPLTYVDDQSSDLLKKHQLAAERRVIGMAIQAALAEDDFETAYSYVVNRLNIQAPSPSTANTTTTVTTTIDDPSWRAALAAGRYRPSTTTADSSAHLRNLHQRMDLLTHALLLAPAPSLLDILTAYRRCEEELLASLAADDALAARYDNAADERSALPPGSWAGDDGVRMTQARRELGRASGASGQEEAPVGLFDVARGAAEALRRSAFAAGDKRAGGGAGFAGRTTGPSVAASTASHRRSGSSFGSFGGSEEGHDGAGGKARRRDMVASAVTGGLASGIGWVLGAKPVSQERE